ncbi:MAG: hypothetical protein KGY50_05205 [Candidatus Thermoplasmatota archaeon]|nr:hypothetical protein [Candidatus Thermoplasmatota archaeon]
MKRMTISIIFIFILFISGCINNTKNDNYKIADQDDLELLIEVNNNSFIKNSPILLSVTLLNKNEGTVYIESGFSLKQNLYLDLKLPNNNTINPAIDTYDIQPKKIELFDKITTIINLNEIFFNSDDPIQIYDINLNGNYNVKMSYRSYYMKNTIYSNEIEFDITS